MQTNWSAISGITGIISLSVGIASLLVTIIATPPERWKLFKKLESSTRDPMVPAIVEKSRYWLWLFVVWFVQELLKHRFFSWANARIDEVSAVLGPSLSNFLLILKCWASDHAFESFIVVGVLYCVAVLTHARLSIARAPKREKQKPSLYQNDRITVCRPDEFNFVVFPSAGYHACKILNASASSVEQYVINVKFIRTFDGANLRWNNPIPFTSMMGPTNTVTDPGHFTRDFSFATPQANTFRMGEDASLLVWPDGYDDSIRRWRIIMIIRTVRPSKLWDLDLCFRHTRGANLVEFMEYKDSIPADRF
jgi:hypothetical protein